MKVKCHGKEYQCDGLGTTCLILVFGSEVEKWVLSYMSKDFLHFFLIFFTKFDDFSMWVVVDVSLAVQTAACAGAAAYERGIFDLSKNSK